MKKVDFESLLRLLKKYFKVEFEILFLFFSCNLDNFMILTIQSIVKVII